MSLITTLFVLFATCQCAFTRILNVGLMFADNVSDMDVLLGYRTSASAVLIARDRIVKEELLPGYEFNFTVRFDQCNELLDAAITVEMIRDLHLDAIIGPTCTAIIAGVIAAFYNIPIFTWGLSTSTVLDNVSRFHTTAYLAVNSFSMGLAIRSLLLSFGWNQFAFVYSNVGDPQKCNIMRTDVQNAMSQTDDVTISSINQLKEMTPEAIVEALDNVSKRARKHYKRQVDVAHLADRKGAAKMNLSISGDLFDE